ncbi:leucyl-tRNA synthetase, putative [Trypanosoma cruzi]|uniref:methionine--tRNA ligase n=2 Tax=Trypanosoma cruzi TaxID=5693 RepID=V5DEM3_TRYCR|nr:leucyl-tRNA synthetase, putative [Trypanosoma cruzi]ESS65891.1 leucyl-tRNA synthetase [Trypanosoma cruzi Dm28c]PBJ75220.1 methionyl-tRNA synthetase [Trypanosoma cruzi cruzi]PWU88149.1 putative methionyl-tRNA synthetase [Trypanosoma cruzi]RNF16725.1 putative methionyl-tRNA synthetase [Trypanosoma cruzi]
MSLKLFSEKANTQALKALLCCHHVRRPVELTLSGAYTSPVLHHPAFKQPIFSANEMVRLILHDKWRDDSAGGSGGKKTGCYDGDWASVSLEEEAWLEWEATTFTCAVHPLYTQRRVTPEAAGAFEYLDNKIHENDCRGPCLAPVGEKGTSTKSPSFLVDCIIWCAVLPALCEGGLLGEKEREKVPHLLKWFESFQSAREAHIAGAVESLAVQEFADFLRAPRVYKLSPKLSKVFFVTTPIYYVNAAPHIGHVYSTLIADVIGRYHTIKGERVFAMSGTDEHGQKVAEAARQKGMNPYDFTFQVSREFIDCFEQMGYHMDYFIRTTNESHKKVVHELWSKLEAKGDIYLGRYEGWYSVSDESFLTAQNVTDGVDKDGKPCKVSLESGHVVTWLAEDNYMFRLSAFRERLLEWYNNNPGCIVPEFRRREVIRTVEKGLNDLSVSRTREAVQDWAIPVPGNPNHCIYVWLDALSNYYTGSRLRLGNSGEELELVEDHRVLERFPADIHVIGKDILKFHAIYWPAFLISAGLPLPKTIVAHGWWTKDRKKISKSLGNVFDPVEKAREFGFDALKYFLLRETGFSDDGDYSDRNMIARLNGELADTLGNLVMRCTSAKINVHREWPTPDAYNAKDEALIQLIKELPGVVDHFFLIPDVQKALAAVFDVLRAINSYVTENAPWRLVKTDPDRLRTVLYITMEGTRLATLMLSPVLSQKAPVIFDMLGVPEANRVGVENFGFGVVPSGTPIGDAVEGKALFPKISLDKAQSA